MRRDGIVVELGIFQVALPTAHKLQVVGLQ